MIAFRAPRWAPNVTFPGGGVVELRQIPTDDDREQSSVIKS